MRLGRALLIGLADAMQQREKKNEEARALMQQYNLLRLKQRADAFKSELDNRYALQQIKERAFQEMMAKRDEQRQKIDDEKRFWASPEGQAKVDYWNQRAKAEEMRARNYRQEKRSSENDENARLRKDIAYLDGRIKALQVESTSMTGQKSRSVPPENMAEYNRLRQMRDERLRKIGLGQDSLMQGPPAPAGIGASAGKTTMTAASSGGNPDYQGRLLPADYQGGEKFGPWAPSASINVNGTRTGPAMEGEEDEEDGDPLGLRGLRFDTPDLGAWQ